MDVEAFIRRWSMARGGAERANYQMFLTELCEALGLPRPDPASDDTHSNDYVFERAVKRRESEGLASTLRIDLYKRGSFILEAKQSRLAYRGEAQASLFEADEAESTAASQGKWDVLMRNARRQAEDYAFRLPADHPAPPFIIVCDVGYVFEVYSDFSGSGRAYSHFPDRKGFRIQLEDLRDPAVVARLRAIWTDPQSLDATRESARVTRQIAERLAAVSRRLERKHPAEEVAHFLMRCIFTMFAEDVDLLPKGKFTALLEECLDGPDSFAPLLRDLWKRMDDPIYDNRFFSGFKTYLKHFNGNLFKDAQAFPMAREEIGELLAASKHDWRYVEPAIFGTLVEQALEPSERRKLGAHYTPRSYVERLVEVTVMEPLRADWNAALVKAGDARERKEPKEAVAAVRAFHHQLCITRVLDPACGTGNFLYVSLELMKRLEGEVLEALAELGETEGIGFETVDPHQFLGIELNVRAAAIAELVLWIGYLQQHYRNRSEHPAEPILKAFGNIQQKDAILTWEGYPELQFEMKDGAAVQIFPNARRPDWPEAEFIVGNPPFVSNRDMRGLLTDAYVDQLKPIYPEFSQAADLVMFFWITAASYSDSVRRIGFVSTSRIRLKQNNAVLRNALSNTWFVRFAVPDHDWPADKDGAKVRVAFAAVDRSRGPSALVFAPDHNAVGGRTFGGAEYTTHVVDYISPQLSAGHDPSQMAALLSNEGMCHAGVKPYSRELHIDGAVREHLLPNLDDQARYAPKIMNGHDVGQSWRGLYVIDVNELTERDLRTDLPTLFGYILEKVKPRRALERNPRLRSEFWKFEANRAAMRAGIADLEHYVVTLENSPQRYFTTLSKGILPDQKLRVFVSSDMALLAVLSSQFHELFSVEFGGRAGKANTPVYNTDCFAKFPFPILSGTIRETLRDLGQELDATRKTVQAEHPDLTLTGLYNVLEKVRAVRPLDSKDEDVKDRGRVLILKNLHDQIDQATADAYGWPHNLTNEQILEKLVGLNTERAAEEAAGHVRWLRPDYQIPRFARGAAAKTGDLALPQNVVAIDNRLPLFPKDKAEQPLAIRAVLEGAGRPLDTPSVSRSFRSGGKRIEPRVAQAIGTLVRYGWITALPNGTYAARAA
ncbi:DNA methyltransferase [Brevundimonas sp. PAMC22021]|uniref:class I SAM-dependent DNA methyltransferase n=1 Tax=Brevundimonas sp. PAMC22021 TaxID=2861285 RepID=UPI001C635B99|nr:DNA methyltransferase [Brevundimonas sp. PAMC22021]QYF87207.1 class I SAM-dependent DNA methyltransferase [Brevundimonas sp. PAMC22021]